MDLKKTEKEKAEKIVTRRGFIKAAGAAAIGASVAGCAGGSKKAKPVAKAPTRSRAKGDYDYDVVVAGTGMGGSAAGAIAAHNGLKTLILEKNPRPGGACSYYRKEGFQIDTGAHNFIRANEGPFGDLTKRLGMGTPIEFRRAKNTCTARGINRDITIPKNFFLRTTKVPELLWEAGINPIKYLSIAFLGMKMLAMSEKEINRLDNVSLKSFVQQHVGDPKVASIAGAALGVMMICPTDKASAGESVYNVQKFFSNLYVSYPKGGAVAIPKTFLKGAEMHGAEVRMNAGVEKIIVKDGRVDHVILPNGEKVKTRTVISTTSVKDTVFKLVGEEHFPEHYVKKARDIFPSYTAVQVKLAFKKPVVNCGVFLGFYPKHTPRDVLGEYVPTVERNIYSGVQGEFIPIYAPVPTSFDPDLAPPGCQLITAVAPAPTLDVELKDPPDAWNEGMMNALRNLIPDFDKHLLFYDLWSVKTTAEWVGKSDGSAITTGQVVGQVGRDRIPHATPIKGLYLAGDNAGPARGVGTELACQSGMDCGDLIAKDIREGIV